MYKDLITYQLAKGVTQEQLLKIASLVHEDWMIKQPGFQKWEITLDKEGNYMDIVYWESKEAAKAAEAGMATMPHAAEWFACYEPGSISSKNLSTLATF
ncbi:MAG: hypothetical protein JXR10_07665 [Cyclobacteriaceae bacterium]